MVHQLVEHNGHRGRNLCVPIVFPILVLPAQKRYIIGFSRKKSVKFIDGKQHRKQPRMLAELYMDGQVPLWIVKQQRIILSQGKRVISLIENKRRRSFDKKVGLDKIGVYLSFKGVGFIGFIVEF